jgi:hypothetical protein
MPYCLVRHGGKIWLRDKGFGGLSQNGNDAIYAQAHML